MNLCPFMDHRNLITAALSLVMFTACGDEICPQEPTTPSASSSVASSSAVSGATDPELSSSSGVSAARCKSVDDCLTPPPCFAVRCRIHGTETEGECLYIKLLDPPSCDV